MGWSFSFIILAPPIYKYMISFHLVMIVYVTSKTIQIITVAPVRLSGEEAETLLLEDITHSEHMNWRNPAGLVQKPLSHGPAFRLPGNTM